MPELVFSVTSGDNRLPFEILESKVAGLQSKKVDEGVEIRFVKGTIHEGLLPGPETYTFLIYLADNIVIPTAVGILSAYVYDKLKSKSDAKLKIGEIDIRIDEGEIKRILIREFEKSESKKKR